MSLLVFTSVQEPIEMGRMVMLRRPVRVAQNIDSEIQSNSDGANAILRDCITETRVMRKLVHEIRRRKHH